MDGKGIVLLDGKEDLIWMEKGIVILKNHSDGKEDLLWMKRRMVLLKDPSDGKNRIYNG